LDGPEVGQQHAEPRDVIYAADKVLRRGQIGLDDRRAVARRCVEQQVDLVARQVGVALAAFLVVGQAEVVAVLDRVVAHGVEMTEHPWQIGITRANLLEGMVAGDARHRAVQFAYAVGMVLAQAHRTAQRPGELLLNLGHRLLQRGPFGLGKALTASSARSAGGLMNGVGRRSIESAQPASDA
jgi:hypothetical protein